MKATYKPAVAAVAAIEAVQAQEPIFAFELTTVEAKSLFNLLENTFALDNPMQRMYLQLNRYWALKEIV